MSVRENHISIVPPHVAGRDGAPFGVERFSRQIESRRSANILTYLGLRVSRIGES